MSLACSPLCTGTSKACKAEDSCASPSNTGPSSFPAFSVIQESLTNIYRHAETQDARIELIQEPDSVTVRVRDFGKGIPDLKFGTGIAPGVGISGMKERVKQLNGELRISRAEPGTLVHATIPTLDQV